ncbi:MULTISPECIES: YihY/virulence factor BrkB family protein [Microbacterium]|uniref:YihY/virulence factor BrkB family protein n=1 Tax=Microbacterium TaxID=33882 RepID=UPI00217E98B7|nr:MULTISPECIES: YihY/virulence factor BrkB family protein [Microbacterium]UWF78526.1 YihY/virulence factor BrkB family protein [Microbacterium neungamense]WCM56705.1 YihY/virulence factor BrkB family protein [Microbacterium sp. EF45047]
MGSTRMGSRRRIAAHIVRRVVHGFTANECPNAAAGLAFYALLALFPTLIAGFALVGLFGRRRDAERVVLDLIGEVLSPEVAAAVQEPIEELATASGAGVALTIGLVIALWTVARYITALGRTMNGVYGVTEGRPYWKAKPAHLLVTVLVFVLVLAAVSLAVASWPLAQALADLLGAGEPVLAAWRILRWPALLLLVVLVVAVLYYFAPNVEQPRFRWVSVGAVIAIAVLAAASAAFGFFAVGIADYGRIYGAFAGAVLFLLWLWIANMALLVGVLFDVEIERARELRAGLPAERRVQLPLRDTRRIAAETRREADEVQEARRIRRS